MATARMQWEDPPEPERGPVTPAVSWTAEAAALRSRPGSWARLKTYPSGQADAAYSMTARINTGRLKAFEPAGLYEACARQTSEGVAVFARYRGE